MSHNQTKQSSILTNLVVSHVLSDMKALYGQSLVLQSHNVSKLPQVKRSELRLGKLLGQGSFSRAYELESIISPDRAQGDQTGRVLLASRLERRRHGKSPLVVKHLRPQLSQSTSKLQRAAGDLVKEAAFLASLQHPNIITIRGVAAGGAGAYADGRTDGFFIVIDRVECTLFDRMKIWRSHLEKYDKTALAKIGTSLKRVLFAGRLEVIRDISSALLFLHQRRLIFRDLKPDNVGFDASGKVKLIDFGLVIEIPKQGTVPTGRGGTLRYMAPETYLGKRYGPNVDVYSLAIVLWEVLALSTFFLQYNRTDFVCRVVQANERPPVSQEWPYGVRALIRRGWSHFRHHRPTMWDFHDAIQHEINELKPSNLDEEEECIIAPQKDDRSLISTGSTDSSWSWMGDIFHMMHPFCA